MVGATGDQTGGERGGGRDEVRSRMSARKVQSIRCIVMDIVRLRDNVASWSGRLAIRNIGDRA